MNKKLKILFAPVEGVGRVNACIGLAQFLRDRGHEIIFAIDESFEGKLCCYGFKEEIMKNSEQESNEQKQSTVEKRANVLLKSGILSGKSSSDKLQILSNDPFLSRLVDKVIANEPKLRDIIAKHNPDVYIVDHLVGSPAIIYSNKPWVYIISANPLSVIDDYRTPPPFSGFALNSSEEEWYQFRQRSLKVFEKHSNKYNHWLKQNGFPTIDNNRCIPESPYLNLYGYPEELDYTDIRPVPQKWFRVDSFIRKEEKEFKLPEEFNKSNGKLIYLSLGSMGCIDVELMKRLVNILSKSKHKIIVSKGLLGDRYELADNMWGERSVPQTKVLPLVDVVITHGGNNTVYEAFSFGKPMIVLPLFADQFDNAQRVHEKGFGIRLDPYLCSEEELQNAIEMLLNDKELKEKLTIASKRIENSNSILKASELIENLVK